MPHRTNRLPQALDDPCGSKCGAASLAGGAVGSVTGPDPQNHLLLFSLLAHGCRIPLKTQAPRTSHHFLSSFTVLLTPETKNLTMKV